MGRRNSVIIITKSERNNRNKNKTKHKGGAGEMAQDLRTGTDLAEDLGSIPCTLTHHFHSQIHIHTQFKLINKNKTDRKQRKLSRD